MEGKISKNGILEIKQGNTFIQTLCPFSNTRLCGDLCPLFGEPIYSTDILTHSVEVVLELCKSNLYFYKFNNERENSSNADVDN